MSDTGPVQPVSGAKSGGVSPRVANAAGLSGASVPLQVLALYYMQKWFGPMPADVVGAWAALFTMAAGFVGGYLTKLETQQGMKS
jgi:hypothetical protein